MLAQLFRFGVVGTAGFAVDALVLTAAIALGLGPWLGRIASYLAAATATFALNRAWTFRDRRGAAPVGAQWARFVTVNLGGFALNYATYAALLATVPVVAAHPVLGVAAGSIVGMGANFALSRRFVFRPPPSSGHEGLHG